MTEQALQPLGPPSDIMVYARRKARMAFLRIHLEEGHPVVVTESHLVEMAASKLSERLLSELGEEGMARLRPAIESEIRDSMRRCASSLVSDPDGRDALRSRMNEETLDQVFVRKA